MAQPPHRLSRNWPPLKRGVADIAWPAVPTAEASTLLSVLHQMDESEWWPAERLEARQFAQLEQLLAHACETVPLYRERLREAGYAPGDRLDAKSWAALPVLTRADLRDRRDALKSEKLPAAHGKTHDLSSGGSTGVPVSATTTMLAQLFWQAVTVRDHLWHRRALSGTLAAIRYFRGKQPPWPEGARWANWDPGTAMLFGSGPCIGLSYLTPVDKQVEWLRRNGPDYLITHPTLLRELIRESERQGWRPETLKQVSTVGEIVPPALRQACRDAWGASIADMYSSQETGYLALQAPDGDHYLIQSEVARVEIVDDDNRPVAPGETGRVLVTPLHNYAMPLIRYDLGDHAVAGGACPAGRGLPTIERIMGRTRNMLVRPGGEIVWPIFDYVLFETDIPIRQHQIVQHDTETIEMKLVVDARPSDAQEAALRARLNEGFGHDFAIRFTYVDDIPRSKSGKYEDFVSKVLPEDASATASPEE